MYTVYIMKTWRLVPVKPWDRSRPLYPVRPRHDLTDTGFLSRNRKGRTMMEWSMDEAGTMESMQVRVR